VRRVRLRSPAAARPRGPEPASRGTAAPCARRAAFVALVALAFAPALARAAIDAEPRISADLTPSEVHVGETARLTIRIENVQSSSLPSVPPLDGLLVRSAGQQMNMRIVNGATSVDVTHTFLLEATRAGDFTIPPLRVDAGGRSLATQAIVLKVVPPGAPTSGGGAGGSKGAAPPGPPAGGRGALRAPGPPPAGGERDVARLELAVPERDLYVGEFVPAELRLLVREGVRVTEVAQPTIEGKAFSVSRKPDRQPQQTSVVLGGVRYHLVTFPFALSALAPGDQALTARIEMNAMLPRSRTGGRGTFDDPFFDSFFESFAGEPRKLDAVAPARTVHVLPLPAEGRPSDFSGGVGRFTIAATAEPTRLAVGDPVAFRVVVSGEGNFDRIALAALESDADWRVYPASSKFEATDDLGRAGRKTFEQAIVPQRADLHAVPVRRFSYFDPEARRYVTLTTTPIALAIAPVPGTRGAGPLARSAPAGGGATADGDAFELAPNEVTIGTLRKAHAPVATRPWFLAAQALPLAGLAAGLVWLRRRERRLADPSWVRARAAARATRAHVEAMERAEQAGDRAAFFAAARRAVQECVAARRGGTAASLTLAEIEASLDGGRAALASSAGAHRDPLHGDRASADASALVDDIRQVFAAADAATYAGGSAEPDDLAAWRARVDALLARLERAA